MPLKWGGEQLVLFDIRVKLLVVASTLRTPFFIMPPRQQPKKLRPTQKLPTAQKFEDDEAFVYTCVIIFVNDFASLLRLSCIWHMYSFNLTRSLTTVTPATGSAIIRGYLRMMFLTRLQQHKQSWLSFAIHWDLLLYYIVARQEEPVPERHVRQRKEKAASLYTKVSHMKCDICSADSKDSGERVRRLDLEVFVI